MKFAVIGGDERSALLGALLERDGHRVYSFAMEKAELPKEIPKAGCLHGAVYGADCVVLGIPAESAGLVYTPLSDETLTVEALLSALRPGQLLCGGRWSEQSRVDARRAGLRIEELMLRRGFTVGNAAITAEGALERMMALSKRTLWRSRVLVTGWGRIARILSLRLRGLGAEVGIAARKEGDRAMAEALGMTALRMEELSEQIGGYDFIVNTVPARILSEEALCCVREDALLLELASPPGGFDRTLCENIGLHAVAAPGLPGKCAPLTAAEQIRDAVYAALREQEG